MHARVGDAEADLCQLVRDDRLERARGSLGERGEVLQPGEVGGEEVGEAGEGELDAALLEAGLLVDRGGEDKGDDRRRGEVGKGWGGAFEDPMKRAAVGGVFEVDIANVELDEEVALSG